MNRFFPGLCIAITSTALAALTGCSSDPAVGYAALSPYSANISTVAAPIFENNTYDRGVEFELADALVKEIEASTPYKVTKSRNAQTSLTGQITLVERNVLSRSPITGLNEEVAYSVTVDFVWRNLMDGKIMLERKSFTTNALQTPSRPNGEPEELARFSVVQQLARDIVDLMRADW